MGNGGRERAIKADWCMSCVGKEEKKMFPYSVAAEGLSVPLSLDEIKWKERRQIKTQSCKSGNKKKGTREGPYERGWRLLPDSVVVV